MKNRSERDVVLDHALRDEENLGIALKISLAYDELCDRVVAEFLDAVEKELTPRLGNGWRIEVCRDPVQRAERYVDFLMAYFLGHPGQFEVGLAAEGTGYPKQVYLRVNSVSGAEFHEHIKMTINQDYGNGRAGPSFWYRYVDKVYLDWGSEEVTVLLYRKSEAVTYFVGHLTQLARAVERALASEKS